MSDDDGQDWMEFLDIICEKKYAGLSYHIYNSYSIDFYTYDTKSKTFKIISAPNFRLC